MRLSIYKELGGGFSALIEASLGTGKPPVLLRGVTTENFTEKVLPVVEAQKRDLPPGSP